jgi:hypothetical protein
MLDSLNSLRWDGRAGHYEVYYLTFTDRASSVGVWIRYTMVAPLQGEPEAALWFLAMDPLKDGGAVFGRKRSFPAAELEHQAEPFSLKIGGASLSDGAMSGALDDASWDLRWSPGREYQHVHPVLQRLRVAQTTLVLPHGDVAVDGTFSYAGRTFKVSGARGGQAHLWGSKHATSWAWVHAGDWQTLDGEPVPDTFVDGVSVNVSRFGREVGPSTPVVGRVDGVDFFSTTPVRVLRNPSTFALTGWRFEAVGGSRKLVGEVDAEREQLAGVTYHDPDGELAYCYNSETASMRLHLYERAKRVGGWEHKTTLTAPGRAHFEYAQRTPIDGIQLLTK